MTTIADDVRSDEQHADSQHVRMALQELCGCLDRFDANQTSHVTGQRHTLAETNWPPGQFRHTDDGMLDFDQHDGPVQVSATRSFSPAMPAGIFRDLLNGLDRLGADATVEVMRAGKSKAAARRGDVDPIYIQVQATVDLTDALRGDD